MKKRKFGAARFSVAEVGLGTWQLGGDWGPVDDAMAQRILASAVDSGVNFFDTADVYGQGLSETRIGSFLKGCSERIFVATKIGRFPHPGWPKNFSLYAFRMHVEASLKRLGIEALDLVQTHCLPAEFIQKPELYEWLKILKKEGKVRNFGLSVESMDEALFGLDQDGVSSLQIIFNIFRQKPIDVLFEKAKEKHAALIVRLPLASGLLSGRLTPQTTFAETDHRHYNREGQRFNVGETFAGLPLDRGIALSRELAAYVPSGMSMAQAAMRWILDFDAVSVVIPGATKPEQIVENVSASALPALPEDLRGNIR
ncbi:MAG: aldo/keto reductase, partial [Candidatus Omnitrophota bacterium]|nr:aldo/keto reductase [Candidatus Omnitrophota bacterium]